MLLQNQKNCDNLCLQKFPTIQYLRLMSWREGGREGGRWRVEGWKRLCVSGMSEFIVGKGGEGG